MHDDAQQPPGAPPAPLAPSPWLWPILLYVPLAAWRQAFARELPGLFAGALPRPVAPATLAGLGVAALVAASLAEAAFYGMLWAARGRTLPRLAAAFVILQLSLFELFACELLARTGPDSAPAPLVALLAGARVFWRGARAPSAFAAAFGSLGAFTLARAALFAALQAGALRVRAREAFAQVALVWLGSHVAWWWLLELARGRAVRL